MKVLIVTFEYPPFAGGIATWALTLAESLAGPGCAVRVLAPWYPGCEALDATLDSTTVRMRVGHGTRELVRFVPGLLHVRRELAWFRPGVALLASDLAHGVGAAACAAAGVPYVPVVHGSEVAKHFPPRTLKQRVQGMALARAYRRASRVVCVSAYVRGLMVDAGFDPDRIEVVRNGIPRSLLEAPRDPDREGELRRRFGVGDAPVILTFARLTPRKGQDMVIRGLPRILERHPGVRYMVAGGGDDASRLQALAREVGVAEAVVFTGSVDEADKLALLDLCEVYVLPSREEAQRVEGLGIALLEAAARGKPLVAGRHGGVPEVVEDGANGWLVDPHDPAAVADAVLRLLGYPAEAAAMGVRGREKVEAGFLSDGMASDYRDILASVASGG